MDRSCAFIFTHKTFQKEDAYQGIVRWKSAHQGEDGFGCAGRQAEGAESRPPESEIPPARQAADQIPG